MQVASSDATQAQYNYYQKYLPDCAFLQLLHLISGYNSRKPLLTCSLS